MPSDPQPRQSSPDVVDHRCRHGSCKRKGAYVVESTCSNCGWKGEVIVTLGHEAAGTRSTARCPRCECYRLMNGNFVRTEPADV